ncbi:MAG: hypothetical protein R2822_03540 [Spirosomataceae bacterium]
MKKAILTIAALAILTIANANAQRGHYPSKSSAPTPQVENHRLDNAIENFQINKLDNIVGLTHKQEHELKK